MGQGRAVAERLQRSAATTAATAAATTTAAGLGLSLLVVARHQGVLPESNFGICWIVHVCGLLFFFLLWRGAGVLIRAFRVAGSGFQKNAPGPLCPMQPIPNACLQPHTAQPAAFVTTTVNCPLLLGLWSRCSTAVLQARHVYPGVRSP